MIILLTDLARYGTLTLAVDPELSQPWAVQSLHGLQIRHLIEQSHDGWSYSISSAGRKWLRDHPA
jgi:hypothetical protein